MMIAIAFLLAILAAPAVASECPDKDRAFVVEYLAQEPQQKIIAELHGADAQAFLDKLGGPVGETLSVIIADMPDPEVLAIIVLDGDCVIGAGVVPLVVLNRALGRVKA